MTIKSVSMLCLLALLAVPGAGAAEKSCRDDIGEAPARLLVRQCIQVSPATRPPCNASNACEMIRDEIKRGCGFLMGEPDVPAFCKVRPESPEVFTGVLLGGGGLDDLSLSVQKPDGQKISAYCDGHCGDWFQETGESDVVTLKKSLRNRKVAIRVAKERNKDRIAGPGPGDILLFIKDIQLVR
ncbi:hypothetical protein Q9Q94_07755 [Uliginosibacterium sp. 31-16]|uniref:hypothetical protein n=1 Tax=Uliginosibacterium sp. 31-16 TaxID=3068315 RepID=UPI00273F6DB0|nr:hypothetical protein [Uliginosibacterium sp. 31-16]MDP5239421.1 hypothetical protein [Uliginosibacterium sp. 31-16]